MKQQIGSVLAVQWHTVPDNAFGTKPGGERRRNKIKEITEQIVAAEKKIDICSPNFYSVAEIRARDDNRVKKEEMPNTGFIKEPDWMSSFIHGKWWRTAGRGRGREKARKDPGRNVIFFISTCFFNVVNVVLDKNIEYNNSN